MKRLEKYFRTKKDLDEISSRSFVIYDMAGVAGFEPTMVESESTALPLGDTPERKMVTPAGFEPTNPP